MSAPRDPARVADDAWLFVGTPNVGKSTLINRLAGSRLAVGNWSGTTLDAEETHARLDGAGVTLVDLPGIYALEGSPGSEALPLQVLRRHPSATVVNVVDAARLERDLALTLELRELGHPMVVCLTMVDEARRRGLHPDAAALASGLGVPVVPTEGVRGDRDVLLRALRGARRAAADERGTPAGDAVPSAPGGAAAFAPTTGWGLAAGAPVIGGEPTAVGDDPEGQWRAAVERHEAARALAERALAGAKPRPDPSLRIDRVALHPVVGPLVLVATLALAFHLTFALADPWINALGAVQEVLTGWVVALGLPALLTSFLADGVVAGAGTVAAFVPVMFVLYAMLGVLENAGILARIAFLADRLMRALGLPGHAVLPIVLASGCNVPAVQATRALERPADRLRVALALPSMACSARLPIFALVAAAVLPAYAGLVVTALYLLGFAVSVLTALLLGRVMRAPAESVVMELPPYRVPPVTLVLRLAWLRTASFLRGAGGPILLAVALIWGLLAIPLGGSSLFEAVARALAPVFRPLGWGDWRFAGALVPGAVAKEVILGSLGVTMLGAEPSVPLSLLEGLRHLGTALLGALRATATGLVGIGGGAGPDASGPLG